jgi:hypothetical protein
MKNIVKKLKIFTIKTLFKCLKMLLYPIPAVIIILTIWYFFFYSFNVYFRNDDTTLAIISVWISVFGILYGLLAATIFNTVWTEYKTMRLAVKRRDLDMFMELRDEEMSPLVHTMLIVLSGSVLLAFMILPYQSLLGGLLFVGSTSYLFILIFFIVLEIDDPCSGTWLIQSTPKEWLLIDVKTYRLEQFNKKQCRESENNSKIDTTHSYAIIEPEQ